MFFKKKITGSNKDYEMLKADMHSHLLPGIDDGSPNLDISIELIKGLADLGYSKLITTPHIMWDMYKNTTGVIHEKLELLKKRVEQENIEIEIAAAAEYFIDDHLEELLKNKQPLLSFGKNLVLVEFSMASLPFDLKEVLFEMQMQGYQPVIAHPERYIYAEGFRQFYDELKDAGCLFQLNALSLSGHYGRSVSELANHLIKKQYYDLIGTDLHHFKHLEALHQPPVISSLKKLVDTGRIINPSL